MKHMTYLSAILLFLSLACQSTSATLSPDNAETITYSNADLGITLFLPSGWIYDESGTRGSIVSFWDSNEEIMIALYSDPIAPGERLATLFRELSDRYFEGLQNIKKLDEKKISLTGGHEAIMVVASANNPSDNSAITASVTTTLNAGKLRALTFVAFGLSDRFALRENEIMSLISSLQFNN